jgi:hypothetical protein
MPIGHPDYRAEDDALIHSCGDLGEALANLNTGDVCRDGVKVPTDFFGSFGFNLPHILVRRAATQQDHDYAFMTRSRRRFCRFGFKAEEVR